METIFEDPNEKVFLGPSGSKYMSTRLVVHAGITVAIALRDAGNNRLAFEYAVLDPSNGSSTGVHDKKQDSSKVAAGDALDSQGWSDSPLALPFSNEVRVVGEEAIPNWSYPPRDTTGAPCAPEPREKLDLWRSTTLSLTENVPDFEVLSDGEIRFLETGLAPWLIIYHRQIHLPLPSGHKGSRTSYSLSFKKQCRPLC